MTALATAELIAHADQPALEQHVAPMASTIEALVVKDGASFTEAGELLKTVSAYIKRVGEIMDPVVTSAHQAHQVALRQRNALLQPAEHAKRILGRRMAEYEQEQERLRLEEQQRQQRERERLEAEERARVQAEQRRLQEEAEQRALDDAAAAEAAGDVELAERIVSAPVVVEAPAPRPVFTPPAIVQAAPKVAGVSFSDNWSAEVTDLLALVKAVAAGTQPITYLQANQVALNQVARALKENLRVPGVRPKNDRTTRAKA